MPSLLDILQSGNGHVPNTVQVSMTCTALEANSEASQLGNLTLYHRFPIDSIRSFV